MPPVWTLAGFVYVAFVVDVFSRRILGWRVANSMRTFLITYALRQAIDTRHRARAFWQEQQLLHHSDAGVRWYNHQRLHSSIGDLPPIEFEHHYT